MSLILDEGVVPALGLSAPNRDYPLLTHVRGLARAVPQMAGWRHFPEAKGRRPFWPIPGAIKAARTRVRIDEWAQG